MSRLLLYGLRNKLLLVKCEQPDGIVRALGTTVNHTTNKCSCVSHAICLDNISTIRYCYNTKDELYRMCDSTLYFKLLKHHPELYNSAHITYTQIYYTKNLCNQGFIDACYLQLTGTVLLFKQSAEQLNRPSFSVTFDIDCYNKNEDSPFMLTAILRFGAILAQKNINVQINIKGHRRDRNTADKLNSCNIKYIINPTLNSHMKVSHYRSYA